MQLKQNSKIFSLLKIFYRWEKCNSTNNALKLIYICVYRIFQLSGFFQCTERFKKSIQDIENKCIFEGHNNELKKYIAYFNKIFKHFLRSILFSFKKNGNSKTILLKLFALCLSLILVEYIFSINRAVKMRLSQKIVTKIALFLRN